MFFLTVVTHERRPLFSMPANVDCLRQAVGQVRRERPFEIVAAVVVPDHLHFLWELPQGDKDFSTRVGRMKALFTRSMPEKLNSASHQSASRRKHRDSGIWQRRFWEHTIRDERDFEKHMNYIHYNPVKHGLAGCPHDWPYSSFQKWVEKGVYTRDWCCRCDGRAVRPPDFTELEGTVGE